MAVRIRGRNQKHKSMKSYNLIERNFRKDKLLMTDGLVIFHKLVASLF